MPCQSAVRTPTEPSSVAFNLLCTVLRLNAASARPAKQCASAQHSTEEITWSEAYKICSLQIDTASRGFSFARDGPLDMRMGPAAQHSAEDIVNTWPEAELGRIFREWGEDRAWRRLASKIAEVIISDQP